MRSKSSMSWESARAVLSLAGMQDVLQDTHTATAGADTAYTVAGGVKVRRVMMCHLGSGAGDIRFRRGAAADATHVPLFPQTYFVVDAEDDEELHFYNTTVGDITIYIVELE